ncbi:regulatory protein RecX [Dietzia kunjamensis]|uniref:regulatory protein RecX n=1 Tax=Dietzia TaxID=37914 RepID=UPI0022B5B47D|nr:MULTISPECIES: regulatory protein RecX [Dietzia]MCZ4538891.1 regulatory protein RecX [Dietzia maris]MCZ4654849.1 regulatory protein RecX [Dietzia kunjamensis]MDV3355386.1 regulatory protein RecX [Dietzia sp. IN118]
MSGRDTRGPHGAGAHGAEELRTAIAAVEARPSGSSDLPPLAPEAHEAANAALRLLRYRPRSEHELRERLLDKEYAAEAVDEALGRVRAWGLVDDADFAEEWVRGRRRRRGRSRGALERELRDKGVAEAHIARAVGEIDESDDRRQAAELVRGRLDRRPRAALSGPDVQGERRRLIAFLARRGYPTGLAVKVVDAELAAHASP